MKRRTVPTTPGAIRALLDRDDPTRHDESRAIVGALLLLADRLADLTAAHERSLDATLKRATIVETLLAREHERRGGGS